MSQTEIRRSLISMSKCGWCGDDTGAETRACYCCDARHIGPAPIAWLMIGFWAAVFAGILSALL